MSLPRCLGSVFLFVLSSQALALSLEDVAREVADKNPKVIAARAEHEAAEKRTGYLLRSLLPSIEAGVGAETFRLPYSMWSSQPRWGISAQMNVYRGGQDRAEDLARSAEALSAKAAYERVLREQTLAAQHAVLSLEELMARKELLVIEDEHTRSASAGAERRVRAGLATETDNVDFTIHFESIHDREQETKLQLEQLTSQVNILVGRSPESPVSLGILKQHPHDWENELTHLPATLEVPEVIEARSLSEAQTAKSGVSQLGLLPELNLIGGYTQSTNREKDGAAAERRELFGAALLVFRLGNNFEQRAEMHASRLRASARRELATFQAQESALHVSALVRRLKTTHHLLHGAEKNKEMGRKYLKLTLSEYGRGAKNSPDVLGAIDKWRATEDHFLDLLLQFHGLFAEMKAIHRASVNLSQKE